MPTGIVRWFNPVAGAPRGFVDPIAMEQIELGRPRERVDCIVRDDRPMHP